MARRKKHEEHTNHERWAIPYGDLVTLLLAFFVVMYSISSVNEGKYRVLSDSLVSAFRAPARSIEPIQIGDPAKQPKSSRISLIRRPNVLESPSMIIENPEDGELQSESNFPTLGALVGSDKVAEIGRIAEEISRALQELMDQGLVNVTFNELWVEVEIKDSILFPSGSAQLQDQAVPILKEVAEILRGAPNPVRVEGFTDDVPINTLLYPSNWELSTVRAASVVRLFVREGIDPARMSALGYGQYRPVAGNDTPKGRAQNRRVVLVVLADENLSFLRDAPAQERPPAQDRRGSEPQIEADGEPDIRERAIAEPREPVQEEPVTPAAGPLITDNPIFVPMGRPITPIQFGTPLPQAATERDQ